MRTESQPTDRLTTLYVDIGNLVGLLSTLENAVSTVCPVHASVTARYAATRLRLIQQSLLEEINSEHAQIARVPFRHRRSTHSATFDVR